MRAPTDRARPDAAAGRSGRSTTWLLGLAVAVLTIATYGGSLDGGFVSDDVPRIERNPVVRSLAWDNLVTIFTTFDDANYIPLKVLSLAIDHRLWGPTPTGFHVTNLAIHVGCALLVLAILRRCGLSAGAAALAAALWAVHPVQVESVAWISERKNVLSGLGFFAAFLVYLAFSERPRARTYAVLLALYGVALLSKMNTVVLPVLALAYETTFRHRLRRRDLWAALPLLVLGAAVVVYTLAAGTTHADGWHGGSPIVTWLSSAVVVFRYLGTLVLPAPLAARYPVALHGSPLDGPVVLALLGLGAIAVVTGWLIARRRREAFWILWFFICLAPMLNVLPFRSLMQDRYLYLPLVGAVGLVAAGLDGFVRAPGARRVWASVAAVLLLAAAARSHRQIEMWDSDLALWKGEAVLAPFFAPEPPYVPPDRDLRLAFLQDGVARRPGSAALRNNLATMAYAAGNVADAVAGFEAAATLAPADPMILVNRGRAYAQAGRVDEAVELLRRAVAADPYHVHTHLSLARAYLARGDAAGARAELTACEPLLPFGTPGTRAFAREWQALARLEQAAGGGRVP